MRFRYLSPSVTPTDLNGKFDRKAAAICWNRLVDAGVDGVLILGSIGEFFSIDLDAKREIIDHAVATLKGRAQVIVGTGSNNPRETIELSQYAFGAGADAVMVIPPYYLGHSKKQIVAHLAAVAASVSGPVYLYNFPARTQNPISLDMVEELLEQHPNIVGIKDTVADMSGTRAMIAHTRDSEGFEVLSGLDENFFHNALSSGGGGLAGLTNVYPELTVACAEAASEGDYQRATELQVALNELSALYEITPFFVQSIKYAMQYRGVELSTHCFSVLTELSEVEKRGIETILNDFESKFAKLLK